ncbi:MAG: hypothetical protein ACXIUZ_02420 [Lysobacteraceae bacterium]
MSATYKTTLGALFLLTLVTMVIAIAAQGNAEAAAPAADSALDCAVAEADTAPATRRAAGRSAARTQLAMPYFSFSRALPRSAEL